MTMNKNIPQVGVNLGGWLSQYPAYDYDHFDTFIKAEDFRRIMDWGCDHIRLPVDYHLIENENQAGCVNERGLSYIRRGLDWCHRDGLNVILDLHKTPGFSFNVTTLPLFSMMFPCRNDLLTFGKSWQNGYEILRTLWLLSFLMRLLPNSVPWNRSMTRSLLIKSTLWTKC